jgi:hypothetical protein
MAKVRQNSIHRPLRVVAFTEAGVVDFPTEFPNGVTFKMTSGATTIASGAAAGDALGNLSYQWQAGDLATTGTYAATFTGTDSLGRTETFPT